MQYLFWKKLEKIASIDFLHTHKKRAVCKNKQSVFRYVDKALFCPSILQPKHSVGDERRKNQPQCRQRNQRIYDH